MVGETVVPPEPADGRHYGSRLCGGLTTATVVQPPQRMRFLPLARAGSRTDAAAGP